MLIVSGIVRISLYPLTAATNARPMPVLPLVGSMSTVLPGLIFPARSASLIMLTPMRSFTLPTGFWLSSLATTSATHPSVTLLRRTSGVWPISSVTSLAIFILKISPEKAAHKTRIDSKRIDPERFAESMSERFKLGASEGRGARRKVLAKTTYKKRMPLGTVKANHVDRGFRFRRVDHLANTQNSSALQESKHFRETGIGGGCVNFLVRICQFNAVIVLQSSEQRASS